MLFQWIIHFRFPFFIDLLNWAEKYSATLIIYIHDQSFKIWNKKLFAFVLVYHCVYLHGKFYVLMERILYMLTNKTVFKEDSKIEPCN